MQVTKAELVAPEAERKKEVEARVRKAHPAGGATFALVLGILIAMYGMFGLFAPLYPAASGTMSMAQPNLVIGNDVGWNQTVWIHWSVNVGPVVFIVYTCTSNSTEVYRYGESGCAHLTDAYTETAMSGSAWVDLPPNGAAFLVSQDPPRCNPCPAGPAISVIAFGPSLLWGILTIIFGILLGAASIHRYEKRIRGLVAKELEAPSATRQCPTCRRDYPSSAKFCSECGKTLA